MAFRFLSLLTATLPVFTSIADAQSISSSSLQTYVNSLDLTASFNPVKESYWTGYPHHRRTPFALSADGSTAYLAYLDQSETGVHVQQVDPTTFAAVGTPITVAGAKEAGGLVAHNDGFALLTNEALPSGTANAPAGSTPVAVLYRYTGGQQTFKTFLGGPTVNGGSFSGFKASPDLNGDLVYSESAKLYGAYFVVTSYSGSAAGHFGDSIQYVNDAGQLQNIQGATSHWGCSHNTGIAFEDADAAPFASICAEDHGAIWLNSRTQSMNGVKISNENVTNGASNEPMGGMSGSYSSLARFPGANNYIFTWVSRGAVNLVQDTWMGGDNTQATARTTNRNVAIAYMSDKYTLVGPEAISQAGAADGDSQVNWLTQGSADTSNAHVAALDATNAVVTWEEIANPECPFIAMGCKGAYSGTYFQLVADGAKVGEPVVSNNVYVAGDMVRMADGRVCWPYVDMVWKLDGPVRGQSTQKMSFACLGLDGAVAPAPAPAPAATPSPVASSVAAPIEADAASSGAAASSSAVASAPSSAPVVDPAPSSIIAPEVIPSAPTAVADPVVTASSTITPPETSSASPIASSAPPPVAAAPASSADACDASSRPTSTTTSFTHLTTFVTVVLSESAAAVPVVAEDITSPAPIISASPAVSVSPPVNAPAAAATKTTSLPLLTASVTPAAPAGTAPAADVLAAQSDGAWGEILKLLARLQELITGLRGQQA